MEDTWLLVYDPRDTGNTESEVRIVKGDRELARDQAISMAKDIDGCAVLVALVTDIYQGVAVRKVEIQHDVMKNLNEPS